MQDLLKKIDQLYKSLGDLKEMPQTEEISEQIENLEVVLDVIERKVSNSYSAWDKVQIARMIDRPRGLYYIEQIVEDFMELHGDRTYQDDTAIVGGIGKIGKHVVTVIAHNKGNNSKENIARNFGMSHPEGYRKALRLMKQAEKFGRPVVCLIDTPGAYCGLGAEERGQGEAIARNLMEMARLKVPIIAGIIGEGGSGGALALGVADRIFMQQNTTYSILSPEGFASILWKDSSLAEKAAEMMKMTASDLKKMGVIDEIVEEPLGGAHKQPELAARYLKNYIEMQLDELVKFDKSELTQMRYERFRQYGEFVE